MSAEPLLLLLPIWFCMGGWNLSLQQGEILVLCKGVTIFVKCRDLCPRNDLVDGGETLLSLSLAGDNAAALIRDIHFFCF